jgi:hypothetical protein
MWGGVLQHLHVVCSSSSKGGTNGMDVFGH